MARLLVVGLNYAPEKIGVGKYTSEMCEWLAAAGHTVQVITAPPYYPQWAVAPPYQAWRWTREFLRHVEVIRCPLWVPKRPSTWKRLLHLASFTLTSLPALCISVITQRPDIIITIAPSLLSAPLALLAARCTGAACWLHIQDFEVGAALDMRLLKSKVIARAASGVERWLLKRFDRVSTITETMRQQLVHKGVATEQAVLFPNWVDMAQIQPLQQPSSYRRELGIPDTAVVALYSGNMNLKQGLDILSDCAQRLASDKHIYFVFGGQGPARELLQAACGQLPQVRLLDLQPTERLNDWLGLADIHLLPQRADIADLVMPSKLTGMLASGRPVIATAHAGSALAQALADCGAITPPGDSDALARMVQALAADPEQRKRLGNAARQQAEASLAKISLLTQFQQQLSAMLAINPTF